MAGKRFYMTASVAREHTKKLWENEGTALTDPSRVREEKPIRGTFLVPVCESVSHIFHCCFSLRSHYRLFFEVPVFWSGGNAATAGRRMFRPVFSGNAGGSTMQVLASSHRRGRVLCTRAPGPPGVCLCLCERAWKSGAGPGPGPSA